MKKRTSLAILTIILLLGAGFGVKKIFAANQITIKKPLISVGQPILKSVGSAVIVDHVDGQGNLILDGKNLGFLPMEKGATITASYPGVMVINEATFTGDINLATDFAEVLEDGTIIRYVGAAAL